jgi:transposase InsO family protein
MAIRPRGRPVARVDRDTRTAILAAFGLLGPDVGLGMLRDLFPDVARAELLEVKDRYARVHRRGKSFVVTALRWRRPGSVWAMDFANPPRPIDGIYDKLFIVRDLPSGEILLALPAEREITAVVIDALEALFTWHGPPVVLKCDNGSPFTAEETRAFLQNRGVLPLYSPPGTPRYNGSVEAGIGMLKTHAHYESARQDRPGQWTSDDLEAARCRMNDTVRIRWGGVTPHLAWQRRSRISTDDRETFHRIYEQERTKEIGRRGLLLPGFQLSAGEDKAIDRIAISKALIRMEFLCVRRKRVSPHFHRRFTARIA